MQIDFESWHTLQRLRFARLHSIYCNSRLNTFDAYEDIRQCCAFSYTFCAPVYVNSSSFTRQNCGIFCGESPYGYSSLLESTIRIGV